jgi:hypothetical protein
VAAVLVRIADAMRRPLADVVDIEVASGRTNATLRRATAVAGNVPVSFPGLPDGQPVIIRVFPTRHRPVAQIALPGPDGSPVTVQFHTPLHPDRVRAATFPPYAVLGDELKRVLECSAVEGLAVPGSVLYDALSDMQKAGLLNLFTKMSSFGFDETRTVWTFVDRLFRVRADRLFVDVQPALRDLVKDAVASARFRVVSGGLHTPPPEFAPAGSFKTAEQYGNLQLTFFASSSPPLAFKVDADIDNAAGLGHAFQVMHNWIHDDTTHPYDIHQILVFRQDVVLPYELA